MRQIRIAMVAIALLAVTGLGAAQAPGRPEGKPDSARPQYRLTGGAWHCDQVDAKGNSFLLGFREDGGCIMVLCEVATGKNLGQSTGRYTLVGKRLTIRLSVAEIRGTVTYLGPDAIRIVDAAGEVKTFKRKF